MIKLELFRNEDRYETFAAGETIFKDGDEGHCMYVVYEGTVRLQIHGRLVEKLGPGEIFGEMALIDDLPRSATAIADSDVKLVSIGEKRFDFLVQQTPKFALQIMRIVADRLRNMDNKLRAP
jgi:CRP/FNR family cyclic AMP-dependent transcriptional regulator